MNSKKGQQGNVLIITTLFFVAISLSISLGLVIPAVRSHVIAENALQSKRSYVLSESGVEDAVYRLKAGMSISSSETISLDGVNVTTTITDLSASQKEIISLGNSNNRERKIRSVVSHGAGNSFNYGIQSGRGGIVMANGSGVNGSVYSNGPITGSGFVSGSATSANSSALSADQQNGSGTPDHNLVFANTNATQDIAQSFQVSVDEKINKVSFYIRKNGSPSNATIHLVTDNAGSPTGTTIATGTLSASLVSTSYGWVETSFSTNPNLYAGTTYWLVIDASSSAANYYTVGANTSYASGVSQIGRIGSSWGNNTPSGADLYFYVYLGGILGLIDGITVGESGVGNAYANTINNSTIEGTNYCQTGSGNNKACNMSLPDPVSVSMPISEQNILDWKDDAAEGGVHAGDYTIDADTAIVGPKKITGNMLVENNAVVTMAGTLWVQGNLTVDNNALIKLGTLYGASSGVIIVDGVVTINNNSSFDGSGTSGSYVMVLTTSYSDSAITISNNVGAVILYAANGTVNVNNNASAKEINGFKISLGNNAVINYETGMANINFTNGPGGSWNVRSWKEIE